MEGIYRVNKVSFAYPGASTDVLNSVSFSLKAGQIHSLVGENGSGKSTLIRIMSGLVKPSVGLVTHTDSKNCESIIATRAQAGRLLGVVHQEYNIFEDLSVTANLLLAPSVLKRAEANSLGNVISWKRANAHTKSLLKQFGLDIDPSIQARHLGSAERKLVEIARVLVTKPSFLLLDEPTASLEASSSDRVLKLIRELASTGIGVGFVSHRLDEVLDVSDIITVLRDGQVTEESSAQKMSEPQLAIAISGSRPPTKLYERQETVVGASLTVGPVRLKSFAQETQFEAHPGEIIGVTGLIGSGCSELIQYVANNSAEGLNFVPPTSAIDNAVTNDTSQLRTAYVSADRGRDGLFGPLSVELNLLISSLTRFNKFGIILRKKMWAEAHRMQKSYLIKAPSLNAPVSALSGGNQQKCLIARALHSNAEVLVLEEPTRGVDIMGRSQIYQLVIDHASSGGIVIFSSSDTNEVLELSTRVVLMKHFAHAATYDTHSLRQMGDLAAAHLVEKMMSGATDE